MLVGSPVQIFDGDRQKVAVIHQLVDCYAGA